MYITASSKFVLMTFLSCDTHNRHTYVHVDISLRVFSETKKEKKETKCKTKPKDRNELFAHDPMETKSANCTVPIKTYSARPFDCKCIPRKTRWLTWATNIIWRPILVARYAYSHQIPPPFPLSLFLFLAYSHFVLHSSTTATTAGTQCPIPKTSTRTATSWHNGTRTTPRCSERENRKIEIVISKFNQAPKTRCDPRWTQR